MQQISKIVSEPCTCEEARVSERFLCATGVEKWIVVKWASKVLSTTLGLLIFTMDLFTQHDAQSLD